MEMLVWNIVLSAIVGIMVFMLKGKFDEMTRLGILLNKTREEIARDHVTRPELNNIIERLGDKFDKGFEKLEQKLEQLAERQIGHGS